MTVTVTTQRTTSLRGRHAHALTDDERFWGRVEKRADGCWLWRGAGTNKPSGYGRFQPQLGRRSHVQAHRWAYERLVGPIPGGLHLDHLCRNRACVRPDHLEPVTCQENLLRGMTLNARNAAKSHCPQGHPYEGSNLALREGRRICRECERAKAARYRLRKKESTCQ